MKRLTILGIIACVMMLVVSASVGAKQPSGIQGNVTVVNPPSHPVPVTGNVNIANTEGNPVPVVIQQTTSSIEEFVIIREGYTVPDGKRLLIDDISVECRCIIPSYALPSNEVQLTATASAFIRIQYTNDKCPEDLVEYESGKEWCPYQDHALGTASNYSVDSAQDGRNLVIVNAGRRTAIIADEGATLKGGCSGVGADIDYAVISAGIGRLIDLP
jgi:hypothetical protein